MMLNGAYFFCERMAQSQRYLVLVLVCICCLLCSAFSFSQVPQSDNVSTPQKPSVQQSNVKAPREITASSEITSPLIEAWAKSSGLKALTLTQKSDGEQEYSVTLQILAVMTALSFLPAVLMMMTSFTRIIIVFAILRQALGLQQSPSNQILIGLSLFLTLFIMAPVFQTINTEALQPYLAEQISATQFVDRLVSPFHHFMLSQTRESDLQLFLELNGTPTINRIDDTPMLVLIPAFVTSELKTAFQIGFIIFIPFLVIDMVVASVLMAMGMMMLSPLIISLPFKIMLFVLVDGWGMLMGTLAASYGL